VRFLEVIHSGSEVLRLVWLGQDAWLREAGHEVQVLDLQGRPATERLVLLKAERLHGHEAVLVRGIEVLPLLSDAGFLAGPKVVLDHCTPAQVGRTYPRLGLLQRLAKVSCYSPQAERGFREAGVGKVRTLPGPHAVPVQEDARGEGLVIGVARSCATAHQVLTKLLRAADEKGWGATFVSTMTAIGSEKVGSDLEVAERCDLLVAPREEVDLGQPHEGAILALAFGRALVTNWTEALSAMSYTQGTYLNVDKYSAGLSGYVAAVELYRRNRGPYDAYPRRAKVDHTRFPRHLVEWVS